MQACNGSRSTHRESDLGFDMPQLTTCASEVPALGQLLVLVDERAQSRVELAPARGGLITSFRVRERELLYMERETLVEPSKNVRGGIPVLFPAPGKLTGDSFRCEGRAGAMKQHGFARTQPWACEPGPAGDACATITLTANDETRAAYPWDFTLSLRISLLGTRLTIGVQLRNTGSAALPFAFGLHPYFVTTDKRAARIDTRATRAFDNVAKITRPFTGFDLTAPELDLHLLDHGSNASALHLGDGSRVELRASHEFSRWVVWTLGGKDFVCLEPWTGPADALNTGEGLLHVVPGALHEGWVELEFVA